MKQWKIDSWREFRADHQPEYPKQAKLSEVEETLRKFPPLVFAGEVRSLHNKLSNISEQNGFLLQGGDCAESFSEFGADNIPERMLKAYSQSASTLNLLRAFSDGGYADLRHVQRWNMGFVKSGEQGERYGHLAQQIEESLNFMEALGINSGNTPQLKHVEYFTSHEALLLPYEEAMTRIDSTSGDIYDTSAHFLWIGDRTRSLESAHVEFCRGINNPIGIKCGPSLEPDNLIQLLDILNPKNENGRITLINRFGHKKVENYLPSLIQRVKQEGRTVIWSCDPMHGNTIKGKNGIKTRSFDMILNEVKKNLQIHRSENSFMGGIHLEMTGQDVTECTGGLEKISENDLTNRYRTHCDPRLNANQAIELAFLIADELRNNEHGR